VFDAPEQGQDWGIDGAVHKDGDTYVHRGLYQIDCRNEVEDAIAQEGVDLARFLIDKNRKYGNSALDPVRIFSKADIREQLLVRIDDKLSRVARGSNPGEDVMRDLPGYLILLRVRDRLFPDREVSS